MPVLICIYICEEAPGVSEHAVLVAEGGLLRRCAKEELRCSCIKKDLPRRDARKDSLR